MVIVRGLKSANREGEVTVVTDIPPPEWILRLNGRSIPIERVEANAKQRKDFVDDFWVHVWVHCNRQCQLLGKSTWFACSEQ